MSANRTLRTVRQGVLDTLRQMRLSSVLIAFFSSGVLAFGLYNIHAQSGVTEGGGRMRVMCARTARGNNIWCSKRGDRNHVLKKCCKTCLIISRLRKRLKKVCKK